MIDLVWWLKLRTTRGPLSQAAPDYTNRWAMVAPAFLTHMCIGSPWAWSVMSGTLTRELGFVASAAGDW